MKTGEQPPATIGPSGFGAVAARAREAARSGRLIPPRLVPFLALIIVSAFFWVTAGDRFMSIDNGSFLLQQSAIIAIPAFGVTMVIISGSIDLSVGSLVALTGMVLSLSGCNRLAARDQLNKGVDAYKSARYEEAIGHFQKATERVYHSAAHASRLKLLRIQK